MNKRVIKVMLALIIVFLAAYYVLKFFFPEEFVMMIETPGLVAAGEFIDKHLWLSIPLGTLIGFTTDYLYFGAVCRQRKLNKILLLCITVYSIAFELFYIFVPQDFIVENTNAIIVIQTCYMILLPMFFTKELKPLAITYSINSVAQLLTLSIRNLGMLLTYTTLLTNFLVCFESYLWLLLLFVLFNFYNKEVEADGTC